VLEMAVPEHAHVSFASEAPYYGFRNGVHCFKRAVLLGANMFGFPDMITAFEFRQRAYAHLGLVQPNTTATTSNRRVVLLDRHRGAARRFHNARDMLALIRGLGVHVEHVVVTVNTTFEEQVRLMASTGVLVSMHGAGLMNQIFLPPGAAVIEVFPVNFKHVLYERIAHYMGVYHFKVRFAVCCVCGAHTHTPLLAPPSCNASLCRCTRQSYRQTLARWARATVATTARHTPAWAWLTTSTAGERSRTLTS
jgi:capsular polysaccharide biosynthesis protein